MEDATKKGDSGLDLVTWTIHSQDQNSSPISPLKYVFPPPPTCMGIAFLKILILSYLNTQ